MTAQYRIVITTTSSQENVDAIVKAVLDAKLAACIQVFPIRSHYLWEGKVNNDAEMLMLFKIKAADFDDLQKKMEGVHAYQVPEVISLDIENGSSKYLNWISEVTR